MALGCRHINNNSSNTRGRVMVVMMDVPTVLPEIDKHSTGAMPQ